MAVIGRACSDCHSNHTVWPWYSRISPVSWLVARDVKEGRAKLNFSQWNIYSPEMTRIKLGEICEEVKKGEMPPRVLPPDAPGREGDALRDFGDLLCAAGAVALAISKKVARLPLLDL